MEHTLEHPPLVPLASRKFAESMLGDTHVMDPVVLPENCVDSHGNRRECWLVIKTRLVSLEGVPGLACEFMLRRLSEPDRSKQLTLWRFHLKQGKIEIFEPQLVSRQTDEMDNQDSAMDIVINFGTSGPHRDEVWKPTSHNVGGVANPCKEFTRRCFYYNVVSGQWVSTATFRALPIQKHGASILHVPPGRTEANATLLQLEQYYWQNQANMASPFVIVCSQYECENGWSAQHVNQGTATQDAFIDFLHPFCARDALSEITTVVPAWITATEKEIIAQHLCFGIIKVEALGCDPSKLSCQCAAYYAGFDCGPTPNLCHLPAASHRNYFTDRFRIVKDIEMTDVILIYGEHERDMELVKRITRERAPYASVVFLSSLYDVLLGDADWNYWTRDRSDQVMTEQLATIKHVCLNVMVDLGLSLDNMLTASRLSLAKAAVNNILRSGRFLPAHLKVSSNGNFAAPTNDADNTRISSVDKRTHDDLDNDSTGTEEEAYHGGLVLPAQPGIHTGVQEFDFDAHYPAIIAEYQLFFTGLTPADTRKLGKRCTAHMRAWLDDKRSANARENQYLSKAAKLKMVTLYGCFGRRNTEIADIALASKITTRGRELLQKAVAVLKAATANQRPPLMGHTDAVIVSNLTQNGEDICREFNASAEFVRLTLRRKFTFSWVINKTTHLSLLCDIDTLEKMPTTPGSPHATYRDHFGFIRDLRSSIVFPGFIQSDVPPAFNLYNLYAHLAIFVLIGKNFAAALAWAGRIGDFLGEHFAPWKISMWTHFIKNKHQSRGFNVGPVVPQNNANYRDHISKKVHADALRQDYLPVIRSRVTGQYEPAPIPNPSVVTSATPNDVDVDAWKQQIWSLVHRRLRSILITDDAVQFNMGEIERILGVLLGYNGAHVDRLPAQLQKRDDTIGALGAVAAPTIASADQTLAEEWFAVLMRATGGEANPQDTLFDMRKAVAGYRLKIRKAFDGFASCVPDLELWLRGVVAPFMLENGIIRGPATVARPSAHHEDFAQLVCAFVLARYQMEDANATAASDWDQLLQLYNQFAPIRAQLADKQAHIQGALLTFFWE